ncbi:hypothetical protein AB0M39_26475 [Streptomyces sp. NPDC051907]|uniref:hypothetical protein n=1 Tax=Streptomyces sp. NPDC051907 TaxID=3155284 RepID=UPI0034446719
MDLETVADELYALAPGDFTAARSEHAAAAREAGEGELARQIQALRRPTLAAWASNLLVRQKPDQVEMLIGLGEGLRQAHRALDGEQLRELSRQQHAVIGALARQTRQLAADAGHPVSDAVLHEVENTLHAVLADPEAAQEWAAGRLVRPLSPPVGFTAAAPDAVPPKPASPKAAARPAGAEATKKAEKTAKATDEATRQARKEQRARLAEARKDAKAAERRATSLHKELTQAETEQERAEKLLQAAEKETAELAEQLMRAEARQRAARDGAAEARERAKEAGAAARAARRQAQDATARAERLAADDE